MVQTKESKGPDKDVSREAHIEALRETFRMIDADQSGTIDASEFGTLLRLQGENVTDEDAEQILLQIDVDGDATALTFDEFVAIMDGMKTEGNNKFDLASTFAKKAKEKSAFFQDLDPLYVRMQREREKAKKQGDVGLSSTGNARLALASVVDGNVAQVIVLMLILLDVICVLMELVLLWTKCPCLTEYENCDKVNWIDDVAYGEDCCGKTSTSYGAYSSYSSYSSYGDRRLGGSSSYYTPACDESSYGDSSYSSYGDSSYSAYGESSYSGSAYGSTAYSDSSYGGRRLRIVDWMAEYLGMGDPDDWGDKYEVLRKLTSRRLAGAGPQMSCVENYKSEKNEDIDSIPGYDGTFFSHEQHEWEVVLHWLSVGILVVFAVQIFLLLCIYCAEFFKEPAYVADLIVVYGALLIELNKAFKGGSLFVILLSWRLLRVIHGVFTSFELQHKQQHEKVHNERNKILEMIMATRRKGSAKKMYFHEFHDKLRTLGVDEGDETHAETAKVGANHTVSVVEDLEDEVDEEISEEHEELKRQLLDERERRAAAESMYVEIHENLIEHLETLKEHTDALNHGHGHAEESHAEKLKKQATSGGINHTLSRGASNVH